MHFDIKQKSLESSDVMCTISYEHIHIVLWLWHCCNNIPYTEKLN